MLKAEDYKSETKEINGVNVNVTSYKIGDRFHCHVSSLDPGATIARAEGKTLEEALLSAVTKATKRLTRR